MSSDKAIRITSAQAQPMLSAAQKKFNKLIDGIAARKKALADWQEAMARVQNDVRTKLEPLRKTMAEQQAEMAQLLDRLFTGHKFSRKEQEKLSCLICDICEDLISGHGRDDLKSIYNKYSEDDFDTLTQTTDEMATELFKAMMDEEFGVKLEDHEIDPNDPRATAERLGEKIRQQQEREAAVRPKRRKSAKQLAKEEREREETANVSKSIQAVYRQLVATLHPDREADPAERNRKTELMQQVTVAYGNKDLLKLLELQLAVEQIDQDRLNGISEERLKHYNKVLQDQLSELREEVLLYEMQVRDFLRMEPFEPISPRRVVTMLKNDIRLMQDEIAHLKDDLRSFQDVRYLKQWLKGYRIPEPDTDLFW